MRIAAFVGVKDEEELIEPCIRHLKAIGADVVTVMDQQSTDDTQRIVRRLQNDDPSIRLVVVDIDIARGGIDLSREGPVFKSVQSELKYDWLLFTDADEFWFPRSGSLRRLNALDQNDLIVVERFNVPLAVPPIAIRDYLSDYRTGALPLIAAREALSHEILQSGSEKRWLMHKDGPKNMCRGSCFGGADLGGHIIVGANGRPLRKVSATDMIIAHQPFSTYSRFERKVRNIRKTIEQFPFLFSGDRGWHWKRWVELADRGELRAEFDHQQINMARLEELASARVIRTLVEVLDELPRPPSWQQSEFRTHPEIPEDFDATAYLQYNFDVARANVDPYRHFVEFGKREGRVWGMIDPNWDQSEFRSHPDVPVDFDARSYLDSNPDVASDRVDPYRHYVESGRSDGRTWKRGVRHQPDGPS